MVLGYEGEAELIKKWEEKYRTPVFTSGTNHIRALHAPGEALVGASYFSGNINDTFAKYFVDAASTCLAMEGIDVRSRKSANSRPSRFMRMEEGVPEAPQGGARLYLLGSGWRVMGIIDLLERDLGVPVLHPVPARCGRFS